VISRAEELGENFDHICRPDSRPEGRLEGDVASGVESGMEGKVDPKVDAKVAGISRNLYSNSESDVIIKDTLSSVGVYKSKENPNSVPEQVRDKEITMGYKAQIDKIISKEFQLTFYANLERELAHINRKDRYSLNEPDKGYESVSYEKVNPILTLILTLILTIILTLTPTYRFMPDKKCNPENHNNKNHDIK
jgi:hypothetical protein